MKINRTLLKLAILSIAMQDCGTGATTPALGSIMAALPNVAPSLVQMIATVPALFIALTPPVYAKCVEFMRKRTLLYIAAVLFIVGGVAPAFIHPNIWVILAFRVLIGIGNGIVLPMATDLVVDFFEGQERNSMMGYVSAVTGISGIVFQLLGGYLAGISWNYTFYTYLVSILFFLIAIIFLPEPDRQAKLAQEGSEVKAKLPGSVYLIVAIFGFFFLFWYILPTNGAIVMLGEGMANPGQIGLAFAFVTVGSFVCSMIFGQVFKVLKFALLPIAYIFGAIGLYICYTSQTLLMFTVGIFILGMGMGTVVPTTMTKLSGLVPYSAASKVIALGFLGNGMGGFIQPMVFNLFSVPGRTPFLIGAVGMVVFAVLIHFVSKATPTTVPAADTLHA